MPYAKYIDGGLESLREKEVYCNDIWDETNRRRWRQVSEKEGDELKKQLAEERARKIR